MSKKALITVALMFIVTTTTLAFRIHKNNQALVHLEHNLEEYKVLAPEIPFQLIENSRKNQENKENLSKTIIVSHFSLDNNFIHNVIENHKQYAKKHGYDYWFRNGIIDSKLIDLENKTRISLTWQKLIAINQAMNVMVESKYKYEWVMWIDGDAVFTNVAKSLEELKKDINVTDKDYFIIARDMYCSAGNICFSRETCVNAGIFLIKNNTQGKKFIQDIIKSFPYYKRHAFLEQTAINDYVFGQFKKEDPKLKYNNKKSFYTCNVHPVSGVKIVPSNVMNSGFNKNDFKKGKNINLWKSEDFILHFAGIPRKLREQQINSFLTCIKNYQEDLTKCELS